MNQHHHTRSRFWEIFEHGVLREIGYPALIVSLVMFVSAMALLGANVSELRRSYARVQHANEALLQIAMVNTDILRAEMTVRGYALNGDPIYLRWKDGAYKTLGGRIKSFQTMFAEDPVQQANFRRLRVLLGEHRAYFERLATRVPTERAAVSAEILDYGKRVGRRGIETMLVVMRDHEMEQLAEQQRFAEAQVKQAYGYAVGISGIALFLGALGFALVIHDRRLTRRG
jgi:CHASE3 domain sensor protein